MTNDEQLIFTKSKLGHLMADLEYLSEQFSRRTQASTLVDDMRERVAEILVRVSDPRFCNAPHNGAYFCLLEKGHSGKHREGDMTWNNAKSHTTKTNTPKKVKVEATKRYSHKPKAKTKKKTKSKRSKKK